MGTRFTRIHNRSNLFLVRLWSGNDNGEDGETARIEWCGKVQRVVNGEEHQFTNLQELVSLLEDMVSNDRHKKQP